jgi:hypothetical protein
MKQLGHKLVDPFLGQSYTRQRECQIGVIISPAFKRQGGKLTISRFAAGVGHRQALIGAFVPTAKGLNSPKMEFFDAVARLKTKAAKHTFIGGSIHFSLMIRGRRS